MTENKQQRAWTESMIAERFEEAVRTLRRLEVPHTKPMGYFSTWPPIVYTAWEIMAQEKLPMRLGPPAADAIDRMDETFRWLSWLEVEERNLVWWRAVKKPWKPICGYLGVSRTKAWEMWVMALVKIAHRLEEKKGDFHARTN